MIGTRQERQTELEALHPRWEECTLYEVLEHTVRICPQRGFLVTPRREWTYRQVLDGTEDVARVLQSLGVGCGARVALCLGNGAEFVLLIFALSALGAVKVPLNTKLGETERRSILGNVDPLLLVEDGPGGVVIRRCGSSGEKARSWLSLLALGTGEVFSPTGAPRRTCDIIYTSGSNGTPTGVMLTSDMLLRSAYASCLNRGFELGRRVYIPLPLFHVYGYVEGLLAAPLVWGSILLHTEKFCPAMALDLMQRHRVNDLLIVPSMMMGLLQSPDLEEADLSALHAVYCSASAALSWLWSSIRKRLHVQDVITVYGMTEVCGATVQTAPEDPDERIITRVGRLLPGGCAGVPAFGGRQVEYRVTDPATWQPLPGHNLRGLPHPGSVRHPGVSSAQGPGAAGDRHGGGPGREDPYQFRGRANGIGG